MDKLKKKYLYLTDLLTSSSDSKEHLSQKIIVILLIGLLLIGFGVLAYKTNIFLSGDKVEVLNNTTEIDSDTSDIFVEIAGAVEKVGVYKMKMGDRIEDLLIISGGLSADADRNWVEKNINRASKLIDGQKIYIYHSNEVSAKKDSGIKLDQEVLGVNNQNSSDLVNVNTASQSELEKLVGIGPVYAQKIIEQRPYSDLQELVSKGAISQKTLEKIKNAISL
ncbi:MAG: helix-hairpin-helix domain-containing protein [Microgenomates group bacterium]